MIILVFSVTLKIFLFYRRYFVNQSSLDEHKRSKVHKRRFVTISNLCKFVKICS